jgi:hypothetical protein
MNNHQPSLAETTANLPDHYHDMFSATFLRLLAALTLHKFSIQRADEALMVIDSTHDLWPELSHPSVWLCSSSAPMRDLQTAEPGSQNYTQLSDAVIRANLSEQHRLLLLLEEFYDNHKPISFYSRLIIETIDMGESNLRPQGASIRIILKDPAIQKQWINDSNAELNAFTDFLIR